jgi:RsiW-degrading membrane proteinase PrsW (M82 family)
MGYQLVHSAATQFTIDQIVFAVATGFIPSFIWLLFWLKRDRSHPEPTALLVICFLLGAAGVLFAGPLEGFAKGFAANDTERIVFWAGIEEVLKFIPVSLVALHSRFNDEPIDPAIYMITAALGFAALENIFYVLHPLNSVGYTASLLNGSLRFFGSTLLHSIASALVGFTIALSPKGFKGMGALLGLIGATFLHSTFNFFILKNTTASFLQIYGYLWVAAIISFMIMEKLRRIPLASESSKENLSSQPVPHLSY